MIGQPIERFSEELARELGLDDKKVKEIKEYLGVNEEDVQRIKQIGEYLSDDLDSLINDLYRIIGKNEDARKILSRHGEGRALRQRYRRYLTEFLQGQYDLGYFKRRVQVGLRHDLLGVPPDLYLGAFCIVLSIFMDQLIDKIEDREKALQCQKALAKLIFMDVVCTLSAYFFSREQRLKKAQQELKRLNRIYWVLGEINSLIVRERDKVRLLDEACRILHELGGFDLVWIGMRDPATNRIRPVAASGTTAYLDGIIVSIDPAVPEGQGPAALAYRGKKVVVIDDTNSDERFKPWITRAKRFGLKSLISFPLTIEGRVVGVLLMYSRKWAFFSPGEVDLLEEVANDISLALEHIEKREQAERLLFYDELTGLANQRRFIVTLEAKLDAAIESGNQITVFVFDIDKFSNINHALGFSKGDLVLRELAKRFLALKGEKAWVGRVGADEFGLIYSGNPDEIVSYVDELKLGLQAPVKLDGDDVALTFSIGCASFPDDAQDASMLLNCARTALQEAKVKGRGKINFYSKGLFEKSYKVIKLKRELEIALASDEFLLFLQPKVHLVSRTISGVEALLRWNHPDRGIVAPGQFIPVLEETGLITEVGNWVIREACRIIKDNEPCQNGGPKLSLNVSPIQFSQRDFTKKLLSIVESSNVDPSRIKIEVTETALMYDTEDAIKKLREIDEFGIEISIDDFGTGYSSLTYLKQIPASTLKIDMSFVQGLPDRRDDVEIVKAIISLAMNLRKKTVAEGVETREQLVLLTGLGVDEIQGYYFSKPLPEAEFLEYMQGFDEERYFWQRT